MSRSSQNFLDAGTASEGIAFFDFSPQEEDFRTAVLKSLSSFPKTISPKFFYDNRGRAIFNEICELKEYYPAAASLQILARYAPEIAREMGPDCTLVEYGSGDARKVRYLLAAMEKPAAYVSIDIAAAHLRAALAEVKREFPGVPLLGIGADFSQMFPVRKLLPRKKRRHLVAYFPGSSIGNFEPKEARNFLRRVRRVVGESGGLLIGVDLKKEPAILHRAYNDNAQVTAKFNKNLLVRINRELCGNFDPEAFSHYAFYNSLYGRIEMHLVSRRRHTVQVAGRSFLFEEGETFHTENSYKYTLEEFEALAHEAAFVRKTYWLDRRGYFSLQFLRAV